MSGSPGFSRGPASSAGKSSSTTTAATTTATSVYLTKPNKDVLRNTILLMKMKVEANGWKFVQNKANKFQFYVLAKDANAKNASNEASYKQKGIGVIVTFSDQFPAQGPDVRVIGIANNPHVHPHAVTDPAGGRLCTERFNPTSWASNATIGEDFASAVIMAVNDLDNKTRWEHTYAGFDRATWKRADSVAQSVAPPDKPTGFT